MNASEDSAVPQPFSINQHSHTATTAMATTRKTVLVAGLGTTVSDTAREAFKFDPNQTPDLVAAEVEKARAAGVDCSTLFVAPGDDEGQLAKLRVELQRQHWDCISIGYAVRALKEHTELFEGMVNLALEVCPGVKFIFPAGRVDIWKAIQRVLGVREGETG